MKLIRTIRLVLYALQLILGVIAYNILASNTDIHSEIIFGEVCIILFILTGFVAGFFPESLNREES